MVMMYFSALLLFSVGYPTLVKALDLPLLDNIEKIHIKGNPVPPCQACRSLVKSFLRAFEETSRNTFEGGDVAWEENKLGVYENSELRFIEIQEKLCSDVGRGKDQCYNYAELNEQKLEEWFYERRKENTDLLKFLCIDQLEICCPENTFGPDCQPCPGGVDSPCGGHGKCENGGTRNQPAGCFCDAGYIGELCDQCDKGYFRELNSPSPTCKICDKSCKNHCRGPGPQNCEVCAFGHHFVPSMGCVGHLDDYEIKQEMSARTQNDLGMQIANEPAESNRRPEL